MARKSIHTSKQLSARRQINAAIAHLHNGEFECAITLAAAAEGQLSDTNKFYLFQLLKKRFGPKPAPEDDPNRIINWLKHPIKPETATICEFEVALTISRAIHKFVAVYEVSAREFEGFNIWAIENGHLPRPLTEASAGDK